MGIPPARVLSPPLNLFMTLLVCVGTLDNLLTHQVLHSSGVGGEMRKPDWVKVVAAVNGQEDAMDRLAQTTVTHKQRCVCVCVCAHVPVNSPGRQVVRDVGRMSGPFPTGQLLDLQGEVPEGGGAWATGHPLEGDATRFHSFLGNRQLPRRLGTLCGQGEREGSEETREEVEKVNDKDGGKWRGEHRGRSLRFL